MHRDGHEQKIDHRDTTEKVISKETNMLHHPQYYGIPSEIVQQAIEQARRERSAALWALLARVFRRRDPSSKAQPTRVSPSDAPTAASLS